jgi:hypothetical protein
VSHQSPVKLTFRHGAEPRRAQSSARDGEVGLVFDECHEELDFARVCIRVARNGELSPTQRGERLQNVSKRHLGGAEVRQCLHDGALWARGIVVDLIGIRDKLFQPLLLALVV